MRFALRAAVAALSLAAASGSIMKYELLDTYDSVASPASIVTAGNARFTVLADSMVRMEYSQAGTFEDRPTLAFVHRNTGFSGFTHTTAGDVTTIKTKTLVLTYTKTSGNFSSGNLKVEPVGSSTFKPWNYGETSATDAGNLRGTFRTLDGQRNDSLSCAHTGVPHCEWGLISRNGWALVDDTGVPVMDDDDFWADSQGRMLRNKADIDLYILAYSHRYTDALKDYTTVGGKIPMFPRNNHGIWFTRWYDFTQAGAEKIVEEYRARSYPLDVLILDMNWHKKDDWSGYSWDPNLYRAPRDLTQYLHDNGLTVAANIHDATGIGKWEDTYEKVCQRLGLDPATVPGKGIAFDLVNNSYIKALEDITMKAIEDDGMDFWWLDWQQGESKGGTGQDGPRLKMNPTIWTDKMRVTDPKRRCIQNGDCTNKRGVIFARFGGLGNHRYQHGFSGDVNGLIWQNLAYQAYFSATASNVGYGFWSHDIIGPGYDPEMYARWLQLGSYSAIMRSHDRGMSSGGCSQWPGGRGCGVVRPYLVPAAFEEINRHTLTERSRLLPYIYTQNRVAFDTGVSITRPMYYYWPEEDEAYPKSMDANLGQEHTTRQYMFGDSILVAPVTAPSTCVSPAEMLSTPCGLTKQTVWVPPGTWFDPLSGSLVTGPVLLTKFFAVWETPIYIKAGAIIARTPVRPGQTLGIASRQMDELSLTVYPGTTIGSTKVYEDDGKTFNYLKGTGNYAWINAAYTRSNTSLHLEVNTTGSYPEQVKERVYEVRLPNSMPPVTVTQNGQQIGYSRRGKAVAGWHYDGEELELVIRLNAVDTHKEVKLDVVFAPLPKTVSTMNGFRGMMARGAKAKTNLDDVRKTPGSNQVDAKGAPMLNLASTGSALSHTAGTDPAAFSKALSEIKDLYNGALSEATALAQSAKQQCKVVENADVNAPIRTSKYPSGLSGVSQDSCCDTCSKDEECTAWVYEPSSRACWPLAYGGPKMGTVTDRVTGLPTRAIREVYSRDLLSTAV